MILQGVIRSVSVKDTTQGQIVITQIESKKRTTQVDELAEFMGDEAVFDIRSPQLVMFGGRQVNEETGEVR